MLGPNSLPKPQAAKYKEHLLSKRLKTKVEIVFYVFLFFPNVAQWTLIITSGIFKPVESLQNLLIVSSTLNVPLA